MKPGRNRSLVGIAFGILAAAGLSGCLGTQKSGPIVVEQDGSSTVFPIAVAWAEEFEPDHPNVKFSVKFSGTGGGFQKFCRREIQISDASRPIKSSERAECANRSIDPFEIQVAIDGLAVVVSKDNTFVDHLTVPELNKIWTANASKQADTWSDVREGWPAEKILLYSPGTNSGTFDYFREVIIHPLDGTEASIRNEQDRVTLSEDDNVLVQGARSSPYGLAYFGLAYAHENAATLRIIPIAKNATASPVEPTSPNVEAGRYTPLARPLFMYTNGAPTGVLREYFDFGLGEIGQTLVEEVGYIKLPAAKLQEMKNKIAGG